MKGHYNRGTIRFNENIKISKTRSRWLCALCHQPIKHGEFSIIIYNVVDSDNDKYEAQGFGIRIHENCGKQLGESLDLFIHNKEKYKILQALEGEK